MSYEHTYKTKAKELDDEIKRNRATLKKLLWVVGAKKLGYFESKKYKRLIAILKNKEKSLKAKKEQLKQIPLF